MAPDLNKKLEDEVEKYRQTQNGNSCVYICTYPIRIIVFCR